MINITRRTLAAALATLVFPKPSLALAAREITWEDLIPTGIPYGEITGPGFIDEQNDIWKPTYDENASKLNDDLEAAFIRLPGFILPLEQNSDGVTQFVLVPYVGACIHTPPPPPNQLVFVETPVPWETDSVWDAVWVTGEMTLGLQTTDVAETGYALRAEHIELYEW